MITRDVFVDAKKAATIIQTNYRCMNAMDIFANSKEAATII